MIKILWNKLIINLILFLLDRTIPFKTHSMSLKTDILYSIRTYKNKIGRF
jgi:hypothetical protein